MGLQGLLRSDIELVDIFARQKALRYNHVEVRGADQQESRSQHGGEFMPKHRLQAAVGGWNGVLTSTDPPPGATVVLAGFLPVFSMLAIFGIGIAAVLIYDTVALTVEERRRDLAVVAALGGKPRTVIGGVVSETAVLGLVGGLLGGVGAVLLARSMLVGLSDFSARAVGVSLTVHANGSAEHMPDVVTTTFSRM